MPGYDKSGPMGAGPMTGGRRGLCNPANTGTGAQFAGSYGYGRGMNFGRGFRGGYGPGRGIRQGFYRGFEWYPPVYGSAYPTDQKSEVDMLKAEADYLKNALDTINKRIEEMESFTSFQIYICINYVIIVTICSPVKGSNEMLKNYKRLNVWQKLYELCLKIYRITAKFLNEKKYGLTPQIRKSAESIPSIIAEGYGKKTTVDYIRMLYIFYGSVCELETQLLLAGDLGFIEKGELGTAKKDIAEIERMLKALIQSLENKHLTGLLPEDVDF